MKCSSGVEGGYDRLMKDKWKDAMVIIVGCFFLLLGFIGLFLPIIQGVLCMLFGLFLLSRKSLTAKKLLDRLSHKYPRLAAELHKARGKAEVYWAKIYKHDPGPGKG